MADTKTLRNLRVTRVDLVDAGANYDPTTGEGAHIRLYKRAEGDRVTDPTKTPATGDTDEGKVRQFMKALGEALGRVMGGEDVAKADDPLTFDDALFRRKAQRVLAGVSDIFGAWYESVEQILYGPADDKATKVKDATAALMTAIKSELPGIVDDAIEKQAGDKAAVPVTEAQRARVRTMHKALGALIGDATHAPGGNVSKTESTQQPSTATADDVLKGLPEEVRKAIDARFAAQEAEIAKAKQAADQAETVAKAEREQRELIEFKAELAALALPGVDVEKDAPVLKKLKDADAAAWTRQLEILKSAGAAIRQGGLLTETGTAGTDEGGESAEAEINTRAAELVEKSGGQLTHAQAVAKLYQEDRGLMKRYNAERDAR